MRRSTAAILAATVLALSGAGCNGDDDGGGGTKPPTDAVDVKPGRWYVQVTAASANPSCQSLASFVSTADSVTICGDADPDDFLGGLDCDFSVSGNEVTVACAGSYTYLGCTIAYSGQATGMFNSDRSLFTLALPVQLATTDAEACGGTLDCVLNTAMVARWVHDGGCTGAAPSLRAAAAGILAPLGRLGAGGEAP